MKDQSGKKELNEKTIIRKEETVERINTFYIFRKQPCGMIEMIFFSTYVAFIYNKIVKIKQNKMSSKIKQVNMAISGFGETLLY